MTVDARSRFTLATSTIPELSDRAFSIVVSSVQPVTTDRAMYFGAAPWGEAHNMTGFVAPGLTWDLAEGRDGGEHDFHTYILLSNPQTTAANVTVTFLREDGPPVTQDFVVGASSRRTIDTRDVSELNGRASAHGLRS